MPVSYTHLDVYKRQMLHRLLLFPPDGLMEPSGGWGRVELTWLLILDVYKRQCFRREEPLLRSYRHQRLLK